MLSTRGDDNAVRCPHCGRHMTGVISKSGGFPTNIHEKIAFKGNCTNLDCGKEIIFEAGCHLVVHVSAYTEMPPHLKERYEAEKAKAATGVANEPANVVPNLNELP